MPSLLITGANRGIGLELTRSYAADGWSVHACCRQPDRARALRAVDGQIMLQAGAKGSATTKKQSLIDPLIYSEEELNVWLDKVKSSPEKLLKTKFELQSQEKLIDEN